MSSRVMGSAEGNLVITRGGDSVSFLDINIISEIIQHVCACAHVH